MSFRRRQEILFERRRQRSLDESADRGMYYSHRLKSTELVLSRLFSKTVTLYVDRGWVKFNGKNYRIGEIEAYAMRLEALAKEREDETI